MREGKTDTVGRNGNKASDQSGRRPFDDNWGLDDPTGQSDAVFEETIRKIEENVLILRNKLSREEKR